MEQDVRKFVESVYRHCASERMGEVNEFIAKYSDPQKCILDAIALFKLDVGYIPQELRTKYISKPFLPPASVDKSKKLSPRKQKMAERRNKADARNRERKGNSVLQRQLSRKEIKEETLRNTKANEKIASLYKRDSKRKKRKSKMVKKHSPSPKRVEIVDEPQVSPLGKLSRQPSDGLPADLQKFMKNGPIVQNDAEEIRSQKSRPQRTLSFDIPDENSQKGHGKGPVVEVTRRKWDDSDVGARTRRVQQHDFLGFKVREVDGLLVVYHINSVASPFKNWLKVGDVVLSVNGMTNLTAEKLHKLQGPMTAIVEKVSNVFPGIHDYNIKDDFFVVKEASVIDHKEEPDIVKENENKEEIKKENESKEEIQYFDIFKKSAEEVSVVQIDTTKVSENKSSKVELLQINAEADQVTRENDMNLASPFSDASNMSETSEGGASPMVSFNSNDSNSNSRKKKKKKSKKRRRKRSKDHDARQQKRLDRIKKHFRDIRRQQGLSEDILEAQVSKDVRGRIIEVLREKIERADNAKSADEVAWKKMEDILELQIDETLHGNISGLTNATSHDLVYNAIKIIFKDLTDKKNEKVDMELQDLPPIQRALQSNTSHSNLSIDGSDGGGPIPSNASDAGGVVNELTFLINESKTTIATLEGLGISTPEINERLFLERENLQNLTNQLLNALPGAGRAGRRSRENSFDRGYSSPHHSTVDPRPLTPQHQTYLSPTHTQHAWSFSESDLSRYTDDIPDNPEIMRQEIHRLRSQVAQNRPLPFANQQLPHPSQQQQMGYLARTRSHSGYLRRSSAFLQMQQNLQHQSRRSSFTSVGSNPSAYSSPNLAMQNRPRAFSADFPEFSGNPYGSQMEFPDRLRQLNPGEISAPMSHPVNPHTLNPPFSNASQPITRNNTGSSSSSDSPQENDPTRKGSMAERAAAGLSVSPRRVLARVPSMTRIGGKTQQVSPRFDASHAVSSILSSSTNTTVHIDTVDTIDDARMFDFSHAAFFCDRSNHTPPNDVRDISSPTSPLHALAQETSFQIHE